jgi:DedD protein
MGLLSIFKRDRSEASSDPLAASPTVQEARARARRRLMGASLLVLMGIIGFPLLFESQPRPIAVDIPIEIPRSDSAPALKIPPARSQVMVVEPPVPASARVTPAPAESLSQGESMDPPAPASAGVPASSPLADVLKPSAASQAPARTADAARAQAALEGRETKAPNTSAANARFVVQVGAFAEEAASTEVRKKVEKLGLKTYTQVVNTSSGSRTRVRIGPIDSKEQANKVAERLKAAGLSAAVLTL